jgi:hypothetical protein
VDSLVGGADKQRGPHHAQEFCLRASRYSFSRINSIGADGARCSCTGRAYCCASSPSLANPVEKGNAKEAKQNRDGR